MPRLYSTVQTPSCYVPTLTRSTGCAWIFLVALNSSVFDSWCDVMKLCHMWWLCWFTTIYHSYQCRIMIVLYPFNWINYHLFVQGESQLDHLPLMRFKDADIMEQHKILRMDFLNVTLPFLLLLWNIAVIMAPWLSSWGNVMHIFHGHSIWSNS